MKKLTRCVLLLMLALFIALLPALANAESETDGVGNVLADDGSASGMTIGGDLYGVGQNVDASGTQVAESAILAGQNISVNNSTIGGSLRAAGYQIMAANTAVDVNATIMGYGINMGQGFSAKAVYAAAQSISFAGTCDVLHVAAQNVTVSGTVNGDAHINANTVSILDGAVVTGTLYVTAESEPVVPAGARVGAVSFTKSQTSSESETSAASVSTVSKVLGKLSKLIMMLPGRILLAVLYYFVIRKSVDGAAEMAKTRAVAVPVTGFVALISMPIAAIILLCTVIGVPAGVLLLCLYGIALGFAVSFAGCMAGKLVFPKLHTLLSYIIGAGAITLILYVPYVGGIVTFAAMIYTLGYFIQKIYLGFDKKEAVAAPAAPAEMTVEPASQPKSEAL